MPAKGTLVFLGLATRLNATRNKNLLFNTEHLCYFSLCYQFCVIDKKRN